MMTAKADNKYIRITKRLGSAALIVLVVGWVLAALTNVLLSEEARGSVLIQALPFVGTFVAIILLFILLNFLVAMRLNGKIPYRTYRPIELIIIGGIGVGIVCLFQPWHPIGYNYGFLLLLGATLGFILWSHVVPRSMRLLADLPPFSPREHIVGAVVGAIVLALLLGVFISTGQPSEPYGMRQRQWDSLSEEAQAEIAAEAQGDFQVVALPFYVFLGLFPSLIVYFAAREAAAPNVIESESSQPVVSAASPG